MSPVTSSTSNWSTSTTRICEQHTLNIYQQHPFASKTSLRRSLIFWSTKCHRYKYHGSVVINDILCVGSNKQTDCWYTAITRGAWCVNLRFPKAYRQICRVQKCNRSTYPCRMLFFSKVRILGPFVRAGLLSSLLFLWIGVKQRLGNTCLTQLDTRDCIFPKSSNGGVNRFSKRCLHTKSQTSNLFT